MRATLTPLCPEFTRPANSSIRLGLVPAALTTAGLGISRGMGNGIAARGSGLAAGRWLLAVGGAPAANRELPAADKG